MFLLTVIKICPKQALFSESSVSQIYFKLKSISKNRSSNFRGFAVFLSLKIVVFILANSADMIKLLCVKERVYWHQE